MSQRLVFIFSLTLRKYSNFVGFYKKIKQISYLKPHKGAKNTAKRKKNRNL